LVRFGQDRGLAAQFLLQAGPLTHVLDEDIQTAAFRVNVQSEPALESRVKRLRFHGPLLSEGLVALSGERAVRDLPALVPDRPAKQSPVWPARYLREELRCPPVEVGEPRIPIEYKTGVRQPLEHRDLVGPLAPFWGVRRPNLAILRRGGT